MAHWAKLGGEARSLRKLLFQSVLVEQAGEDLARAPGDRQRISRSGFYKLMKQSFADFRPGQRATDICSHCQCYWDHIVPRFHRDWNKAKADLTSVYPRYFAHMPENQVFADAGKEAAAALRYVRSHCQRHQQERAASGCDLLQLRTFTEGPAELCCLAMSPCCKAIFGACSVQGGSKNA